MESVRSKAMVPEMLRHIYNSGHTEQEEAEENVSSLKDAAIVKTKEKKTLRTQKCGNQGNRGFF